MEGTGECRVGRGEGHQLCSVEAVEASVRALWMDWTPGCGSGFKREGRRSADRSCRRPWSQSGFGRFTAFLGPGTSRALMILSPNCVRFAIRIFF